MGSPLETTDPVPEDLTDISLSATEDPTERTGFRDEPTGAAETRTLKFQAPPWLATPDPLPRERPRDPLFWPFVICVVVLVCGIGFMLVSDPHKHASQGQSFGSP